MFFFFLHSLWAEGGCFEESSGSKSPSDHRLQFHSFCLNPLHVLHFLLVSYILNQTNLCGTVFQLRKSFLSLAKMVVDLAE